MKKLINTKKYLPVALALAGFAVAGIGSALAQSFNPEIGTGNTLQFSYGQTAQTKQLAARQNGLDAFAMICVLPPLPGPCRLVLRRRIGSALSCNVKSSRFSEHRAVICPELKTGGSA